MMAANLYHLLAFLPATERWEMPPALEALAQALVTSGKLRINAEQWRNFVTYGTQNSDTTFTARELTDPALTAATHARVARLVAPAMGENGIADLWKHLRGELKKARGVSLEQELRVARVLTQSAHPAVIQLLIESGAEIFVSYFHSVADLMAVHEWEGHGKNSGLQAVVGSGTAVYVSAGGDPFFEGEQKRYDTDGFPALARMVVIAGQELGHFADLYRTPRGIIGRHSIDPHHSQLRANPVAAAGRLKDSEQVQQLEMAYGRAGLPLLRRAERSLEFYHKRLRYSPPWFAYQLVRWVAWMRLVSGCRKANLLHRFNTLPYFRLGDAIEQYLGDMAFNLAPDSEVYRNPDPLIEEAIAVIEAVARVPQQVNKWEHNAVMQAWPNLYLFYYETVIDACMHLIKQPLQPQIMDKLQNLKVKVRRRLRPCPAYYP